MSISYRRTERRIPHLHKYIQRCVQYRLTRCNGKTTESQYEHPFCNDRKILSVLTHTANLLTQLPHRGNRKPHFERVGKNHFSMKGIVCSIIMLITTLTCYSQTIGQKKNIKLKLISYGCGDNCYIELKDVEKGIIYNFHNIDKRTQDNGILKAIQNDYYAANENDSKLVGQVYTAIIEYRITDEFQEGPEGHESTNRKVKKWMINSLKKFVYKNVMIEGVVTRPLFDWVGTSAGNGKMEVLTKEGKKRIVRIGLVNYGFNDYDGGSTQIFWPDGSQNEYLGKIKKGMSIKLYGKTDVFTGADCILKIEVTNK